MTRSRMEIHADEDRAEEKVEGYKQQPATEPTLEPVSDFVELEEILEDEDDQERETQIKESEIEIKMKGDKEKEKGKIRKRKKKKRRLRKKKRSKHEVSREKKREITLAEGKEVPYPLVPSKKDKEPHLARFLDIFKKFLKDMMTKKIWYIHSDTIIVEGNCSAVSTHPSPEAQRSWKCHYTMFHWRGCCG